MLETELREKNQQIAQFQERQREFNVLLRSVNEQLALAAAPKSSSTHRSSFTTKKPPETSPIFTKT
ncbi:MAG: hypothetical protein KDB01_14405 [Planctomycetaceae bacterium]|nr:hypothetical protein [Planctomycetaceae bacterium]